MRTLHWNYRGLALAVAVQSLRAIIGNFNPDILFFVETKISDVSCALRRLDFVHFVQQPPLGRKGGLALTWHPCIDLEVFALSQHFINVLIFLILSMSIGC